MDLIFIFLLSLSYLVVVGLHLKDVVHLLEFLLQKMRLCPAQLSRSFFHYKQTKRTTKKLSLSISYNLHTGLRKITTTTKDKTNYSKLILIVAVLILSMSNIAHAAKGATQDLGLSTRLLTEFEAAAKTWGPAIQGYSLTLFKLLISIELAWLGIQATLKQYDLKQKLAEFVLLVIYGSFMASVVFYSAEWTTALIKSFSSVAVAAGAQEPNPEIIFLYGLNIIGALLNNLTVKIHVSIGILFCCVILAVTFSLMTAQLILVKCESFIVLNAGAILLGFGGSKFTKDFTVNYLKYSLAIAAKLFTLQLLMSMCLNFIEKFTTVNSESFADIFIVVCSSIIILVLIKYLPAKVAELVNVSQVSGGGALTSAMSAIGITTMTAMQMPAQALGGAVEAKRGMDTLKEAFNMAGSQGATGLGKGMQALKNLGGAARDNIGATNMGNLRSTITSHHEAFKMQQPAGPSTNFQLP
ncbi:P-type conjugative transfer protein TrbL [Marinifilum sp. JC120]|nr:P-type conjugative transfer protein TrbL [Marinifilum sp. JC120]